MRYSCEQKLGVIQRVLVSREGLYEQKCGQRSSSRGYDAQAEPDCCTGGPSAPGCDLEHSFGPWARVFFSKARRWDQVAP